MKCPECGRFMALVWAEHRLFRCRKCNTEGSDSPDVWNEPETDPEDFAHYEDDPREACTCCGGIMRPDGRCMPPIIRPQCRYFGLDFSRPVGERFVCLANGRKDGKCGGELKYSRGS